LAIPSNRAWIAAWVMVGVALVGTLAIPSLSLPADSLGVRRFLVPIDGDTEVSQTFVMTADGFHAVELHASALGEAVAGRVRFELLEEGSGVVRSGELEASDLLSTSSYLLEFEPIDDSKDSIYRLDLTSSPTSPVSDVGVWATKGARYPRGSLQINERERWADLAFETFAPAGRSTWDRLMAMKAPPPGVSRTVVILGALAAYWLASGFVLFAFGRWRP
jgi:hypothetical protein